MSGRTYGERVDAGEPISEVWSAMMDFHKARGEAPIGGRLWVADVDGRWRITVNGFMTPQDVGGVSLAPVNMLIEYNGWLAGICDMFEGVLVRGSAANEDALIAALRKAATS